MENTTRRSFIRPKLRILLLSRSAFAKTSCSPEMLRIRVVFRPICSTVPLSSPTTTKSPGRNGLSNMMAREAKRSPRMLWTARAIAMPPTPRPAISAVTSTPKLARTSSRDDGPDRHLTQERDEAHRGDARAADHGLAPAVMLQPFIDQVARPAPDCNASTTPETTASPRGCRRTGSGRRRPHPARS